MTTRDRTDRSSLGTPPLSARRSPLDEDRRRPSTAALDEATLDEPTLVVRAQEGDLDAFSELVRRHRRTLYRVAVRVLGDSVDAEDAVQDALLDAWRRIGSFRAEAGFGTWTYRIVTNRCLAVLRARPRTPFAALSESTPAPDDPERSAEVDAELAALGRAIRRLPDEQRVCWVLRELEGLSPDEIARSVGVGPDAVRGRLHRARVALARTMREWR